MRGTWVAGLNIFKWFHYRGKTNERKPVKRICIGKVVGGSEMVDCKGVGLKKLSSHWAKNLYIFNKVRGWMWEWIGRW